MMTAGEPHLLERQFILEEQLQTEIPYLGDEIKN
jgi:hypothetical protein